MIRVSQRSPLHVGVATALVMSALTVATPSFADIPDPDPWFGRDKALHFGAAFTLASAGYGLGVGVTDRRWSGLLIGGGVSLGLGAAKEGLDAAGLGHASWKDFAWDCVGAALGIGVSLAFDVALRGTDP